MKSQVELLRAAIAMLDAEEALQRVLRTESTSTERLAARERANEATESLFRSLEESDPSIYELLSPLIQESRTLQESNTRQIVALAKQKGELQ